MIKKLQRKFVWITMASLLAVLTLVVIAINCMNIYQISRKSDELLTMLADNNGNFPENGHMSDGKIPQPRPGKPENEDVYKRQNIGFAGDFPGGVHIQHCYAEINDFHAQVCQYVSDGSAAARVHLAQPVSYTHLDVYKRQVSQL